MPVKVCVRTGGFQGSYLLVPLAVSSTVLNNSSPFLTHMKTEKVCLRARTVSLARHRKAHTGFPR